MTSKYRALVLNGPNLNLLGGREPEVYGTTSWEELVASLQRWGEELAVAIEVFQSNHEGELLDAIQRAPGRFDFLVINPGAYGHTSVALRDALAAVGLPAVEVHLTNIYAREGFRRRSLISPVCRGVISGLGPMGYRLALEAGTRLAASRR